MNKKTMNLLEKAISQEKGVETEAVYFGTKSALTRFTLNRIHQNMARDDAEIQIRVIIDGREGTFTTNQLTSDGLHQAFHAARKIALSGPRCENFPGLPRGRKSIEFENISPATLRCTPAKRAELVKKIIKAAKKAGTEAAGALSTRTSTLAVANSSGIRSYQKTTMAELNFVPSRGELSGYAYWAGADIDELPPCRTGKGGRGCGRLSQKARFTHARGIQGGALPLCGGKSPETPRPHRVRGKVIPRKTVLHGEKAGKARGVGNDHHLRRRQGSGRASVLVRL